MSGIESIKAINHWNKQLQQSQSQSNTEPAAPVLVVQREDGSLKPAKR